MSGMGVNAVRRFWAITNARRDKGKTADEGHHRDRLHPGGGPHLHGPARCQRSERSYGRRTDEDLDGVRQWRPGAVPQADDGGDRLGRVRDQAVGMTETIFAPATAPGRAALAVVRVSGPATRAAVEALAGGVPSPRQASLRKLRTAEGVLIDEALVLWFEGPASYTGENCAEFHVHGGLAVVDALVEALSATGLRLAEPGEFTRRAFQNGKLDLAQAEAVADLIDAETTAQARQA